MQIRRLILALSLVLVVGGGLLYALIISLVIPDCHDEILLEAPSEASGYTATAFVRDCGATTGAVTHVNLRPHGKKFDGDRYPIIFLLDGATRVTLRWTGRAELEIGYQPTRHVPHRMVREAGGVKIVSRADDVKQVPRP